MIALNVLSVFIILVVAASPALHGYKVRGLLIIGIAMISATVVSFLRLPDVSAYESMYQDTEVIMRYFLDPPLYGQVYGEPLYTTFASLAKTLGVDFSGFRFIVVAVIVALKLWFLLRVSPYISIAAAAYFVMFFYHDSFLVRQALASGIVGLGIWYLLKDRWLPVFVSFSAASLVHVSSLVAFPLYFHRWLPKSTYIRLWLVVVIFIVGLFGVGNQLASLLVYTFGQDNYITDKLIRYSVSRGEQTGIFRGSVFLYTVILVMYLVLGKLIRAKFLYYDFFAFAGLYSLFLLVGMNDFGIVGDRLFRVIGFVYAVLLSSFLLVFPRSQKASVLIISLFPFAVVGIVLGSSFRIT